MEYRVLALGDVASETGLTLLEKKLRAFKREQRIDFTVVNGENISGTGLTRAQAEELLAAGADVVTLGNHTFGKPQIAPFLDDNRYILRPANFTGRAAGRGCAVYDCGAFSVAVLVLIGRCDLDFNADNPFTTADRLLKTPDKPTFTLVEFHAQATSEKLAMAYYLDVGHPHPCAHRRCPGVPQGYGLRHRSGYDRPGGVRAGHPSGAVHGVLSGRAARPLSGGGRPLRGAGLHFYVKQRHRPLYRRGAYRDQIKGEAASCLWKK